MSEFQDKLQNVVNRISSDIPDDPKALHAWFEIRGIPWKELQKASRASAATSHREAAWAYGLMIGWELHAEVVSKDAKKH